jgi:cytosine/adenosine deaminase-related metal-dependent hydrolase
LLDELRVAESIGGLDDRALESLVTSTGARLLRLADRGVLKAGARADLLVLPAGMRLATATRADIRLVVLDGRARYGDKDRAQAAAPEAEWADVRVDGKPKVLDRELAVMLRDTSEIEPGLELQSLAWRAA